VVTFGGITGGDSHNFFLSRAAETGIVGLALIFYFFINYFQVYSRGIRKAKLLRLEHAFFGAGAVVIGALARGFFEGKGIMGGGGVSFELFFWLMVAFTLRVSESFKNQAIK
jgi:O-antigen ligase